METRRDEGLGALALVSIPKAIEAPRREKRRAALFSAL
jgi:hypothetical protein